MKKTLEIIINIYSFILIYIFSFLMHVLTAYCVYDSYGAFLGLIAFFSPVISTIIMMILYSIAWGIFNAFNIIVFIYLLLYIPLILLTILLTKLENNEIVLPKNKYILWEKRIKTPEEMTEKEYNDKWFNELVEKNKKEEEKPNLEKAENEWQEYLESNFKTEGTRTYSKDILIEKTNKFCTNCGKEINENWNFCNHCGHKLK